MDQATTHALESLATALAEGTQLREALADIAADLVMTKIACARLVREASAVRVENLRLREQLARVEAAA